MSDFITTTKRENDMSAMSPKFYELNDLDRKRVNAFIKELVTERESQRQVQREEFAALSNPIKESE